MKLLLMIIGATLLAGCANTGTSGASGTSHSEAEKPYSMRVFNPDDPYHGG